MKRFILLAVAALAFVGCNKMFEDEGNSRLTPADLPTLTAGFEDADTRTYVKDNIYLRWHEDDQISAFYGSTLNSLYQFMGDTGANSGTFTPVASGNLSTGNTLDRIYAVYPYDAEATISDLGVISYSIPATQTYAESSFGKGSNTMVAVTENIEDTFLSFKNIGGYLKIKLYGKGRVKSIELRGNNGEKIAGKATITATYGATPMVVMADDASDAITLDCGAGVELSAEAENPTEFWIVVPPTTFEGGITVTVTNTEGGFIEKSTKNTVTIERNIIQPMAAVEVLEFEIAKPANNEIWYTSTDGEVVAPYNSGAFGVNITSNTYTDGKGVITFDGDVTTIGDFAFGDCTSLTSITIPDSVKTIGYAAFQSCGSLTSVTIPDSVTTIGVSAFCICYSLTSVTIPDSVNTIGEEAFYCCFNLKEFKGKFASDDGRCLIVDGVLNSFAIGCGDTEYTIPDSVTTIGGYVFYSCDSLTSVTIPDSVKTIGNGAFGYCTSLESVTIGDSVTTIGDFAFGCCHLLTNLTIGESVTTIGDSAFAQCISLTSVTIPDSVNTIGGSAFSQCVNLKEFKGKFATDDGRCLIVDGVLNSFAIGCGDTEYTIPDSVNTIGHTAFGECTSLTSITIPDSVKTIEGWAFGYCTSLESVTIPDSVTTIGNYAFVQCYSLTSVTIPDSVKTIGGSAFHSCNNLTSVYCKATTPPSLGDYEVFAFNADNRKIIVPSESLSAYRGTVGWSLYADDIVSEDWGSLDTPNVEISNQNDTTITLSWDTIDGASKYTLSIEGSIYGPYTTTATSYTFELPDAGSYSISVQAFDDEGNASYPVSIEFVMGNPNSANWFTQKLMTTAEIEKYGMDPSTTIAFTWKGKNIVDFRYYANVTSYITGFDDSVIIQNMHSANVYLEDINSDEGCPICYVDLSPNTSYTIFAYAVNNKGAKLFVREERTTAASL